MLVNLLQHPLSIVASDGAIVTFAPAKNPAFVSVTEVECELIDGFPCVESTFGEVVNLPDPEPGVYYIVSIVVMAACPERTDLIRPDTGPTALRNRERNVVAVRRFTR